MIYIKFTHFGNKIARCLLKEIIFSLAHVLNMFKIQRIFENLTKVT